MKSIKMNPRQTRSVLIAAILSVVIATPVMSQPLGLTSIITTAGPVQEALAVEEEPQEKAAANVLAAPEDIDTSSDGLSRSQSENVSAAADIEIADVEKSADEPEEATEPEETFPEYTGPEFEPQDKILYIDASELNMRQSFSEDAPVILQIPMGKKVKCIGESEEWLRIEYDGRLGYVAAEYASEDMVFVPVDQTRYVDANSLNMRTGPSTEADVVETLSEDAKITRIGVGDGWSKVKSSSGKEGFVSSEYITDEVPASVLAAQQAAQAKEKAASQVKKGNIVASADRSKIVDVAWSGIGVPYVYGGSSLGGFDCSGFTSWVYRQVGVNIPRSSSGYYGAGQSVSLGNIKPGDVVAMDANPRDGRTAITHVGIYVGNGQMLHASTSKRRIVAVNLNTFLNYNSIRLITIRRFVN